MPLLHSFDDVTAEDEKKLKKSFSSSNFDKTKHLTMQLVQLMEGWQIGIEYQINDHQAFNHILHNLERYSDTFRAYYRRLLQMICNCIREKVDDMQWREDRIMTIINYYGKTTINSLQKYGAAIVLDFMLWAIADCNDDFFKMLWNFIVTKQCALDKKIVHKKINFLLYCLQRRVFLMRNFSYMFSCTVLCDAQLSHIIKEQLSLFDVSFSKSNSEREYVFEVSLPSLFRINDIGFFGRNRNTNEKPDIHVSTQSNENADIEIDSAEFDNKHDRAPHVVPVIAVISVVPSIPIPVVPDIHVSIQSNENADVSSDTDLKSCPEGEKFSSETEGEKIDGSNIQNDADQQGLTVPSHKNDIAVQNSKDEHKRENNNQRVFSHYYAYFIHKVYSALSKIITIYRYFFL